MPKLRYCLYLLISLLSIYQPIAANEANHTHASASYLISPPPVVKLDDKDHARLKKGKRIYKSVRLQGLDQTVVVFRVNASKNKIWQTILDYPSYPDWIKDMDHAQIYRQEDQYYYVNFLIGHWLLGKFHYSVKHYLSGNGWMKWHLNDSRTSDFSFATGFWRVMSAVNENDKNDVFYAANFKFKEHKSEFIRKRALKAGLKETSIWLPREAEK